MEDFIQAQPRSEPRRLTAQLVLIAAVSLAVGHCLRQPSQMGANDISRWCTVWSLLERGTYVIDDCPWQLETQDKVLREPKGASGPSSGKHFYSSKPALLPTLIAGLLYPARIATGIPLDRVVLQERQPRWSQKPDPRFSEQGERRARDAHRPREMAGLHFLLQADHHSLERCSLRVLSLLFARRLDRLALGDWSWFFCLIAAAFGTYLLPFTQTLNNHTVAAWSTFFAALHFLRIWDDRVLSAWRFAAAGFFAAFAAANELPALAMLPLLFCLLVIRHPRASLLYFIPARSFRSVRSWPLSTPYSAS